jgi:NADPH-ferrihemoprotein reductase
LFDYAVFGLGNKQYDHYNAIGTYYDIALAVVGGNRIQPLGMGDDDNDLEADFDAWKESTWHVLLQKYGRRTAGLSASGGENEDDEDTTTHLSSRDHQETTLPECPVRVIVHENTDTTTMVSVDASDSRSPPSDGPPPSVSDQQHQHHPSSRHYFFSAVSCTVTKVQELLLHDSPEDDSDRRTVHMELSGGTIPPYETADNLAVLPQNSPEMVNRLLRRLGYYYYDDDDDDIIDHNTTTGDRGDTVISLAAVEEEEGDTNTVTTASTVSSSSSLSLFPQPDTLRNILTNYYDLSAAPRRSDLRLYARYCHDPVDRAFLTRLASADGRVEYRDKILDDYVNIVTLLERTPSLQIPLAHFLHYVPLLQPRYFTIASSSRLHPDRIHLTVAVTRHDRNHSSTKNNNNGGGSKSDDQSKSDNNKSNNNKSSNNNNNKSSNNNNKSNADPFFGLCSHYLAGSVAGQQTLRVFVRPSTFRLPSDIGIPIILIGPGTGIAPMRAFLQERSLQDPTQRGKTILYFGCQKANVDYLYRDELVEYQRLGVLDELRTAFSRQGGAKVYVQHLLQYHAEETADLILHQRAHVYVCGAVQMGHDVNLTLQRLLTGQVPVVKNKNGGPTGTAAAKDYLDQMSAEGRYVQELWT